MEQMNASGANNCAGIKKPLEGCEIVLGVTGGIAAYKSCELVSRLKKLGACIHVIETENAAKFVAPVTFETLSSNPVVVDTFSRETPWEVKHIALAKRAELFVVAPATANIMAKMVSGIADDMLSTTLLATKAAILLAPAMNTGMWTNPATMRNVVQLKEWGVQFVGPESGNLACGDSGTGRMSEPEAIVSAVMSFFERKYSDESQDLAGVRIMVTAGATRERIDPVRFISNDSSGKMGFALAKEACRRGASVLLVYGITTAEIPSGHSDCGNGSIDKVHVESTMELYNAVCSAAPDMDIVIQAAAPCDYRVENVSSQKIKKEDGKPVSIKLVENPDIAAEVGKMKKPGQFLIGFAAETQHVTENAREKLKRKNLDMIVANDVTKPGAGFNVDTNIASLITSSGITDTPLESKTALANRILDWAVNNRKNM